MSDILSVLKESRNRVVEETQYPLPLYIVNDYPYHYIKYTAGEEIGRRLKHTGRFTQEDNIFVFSFPIPSMYAINQEVYPDLELGTCYVNTFKTSLGEVPCTMVFDSSNIKAIVVQKDLWRPLLKIALNDYQVIDE